MLRKTLAAAAILLAAFHAWLLFDQVWDGRLTDPAVMARWVMAGGVAWFLTHQWRRGAPLFWGRKAVAVWLLGALLHGPAVAERLGAPSGVALPEVVATLTQVTLGVTVITAIVLLLGFLVPRRRRGFDVVVCTRSDHAVLGALSSDAYLLFVPRPPPVASAVPT